MKYDIDLIMWDLDGTLLDTKPGIILAIKETLDIMKLHSLTDDELNTFIGPPFGQSFPKFYGDDKEQLKEFIETFRDIYKNKTFYIAEPFDGIVNTMKTLKERGKKQTLCTYKMQSFAEKLMEHYKLDQYLNCIYGSSVEEKITKSAMLINSAKYCHIDDMKKTVLVGDTRFDYAAAILARSNFIAANYGYGDKLFKEADYGGTLIGHINTAYEIIDYII